MNLKIQLQMFIEDAPKSINGAKKMLISIDPSQLQRLSSEKGDALRVGQSLTLAITKIGSMPEFKQLPSDEGIDFLKTFGVEVEQWNPQNAAP